MNNSEISSYAISFEGNQSGIDRLALENIAINGLAYFPQNLTELKEVFTRFSNSVATVYHLVYNTNNAKLSNLLEYRFLFQTTLISD